ncbi:hypothetical protein ACVGWF_19515, partial [Enterobacter asburiae]
VSPVAPLWLMAIAPLIALLLVPRVPPQPPLPPLAPHPTPQKPRMHPVLLVGLLQGALLSLMPCTYTKIRAHETLA